MKRFLAFAFLVISFMMPAFALNTDAVKSAGFSQLTDPQKAEIISQIAKQAEQNNNATASSIVATAAALPSTPAKVAEWVDIGTKIGQAFGGAAKEVGVAVNDFVKTPVGQWTMAIIVWKFIGGAMVHVLGSIVVLIAGFGMMLYIMRRQFPTVYTYNYEKMSWLGRPQITSVKTSSMNSDQATGYIIVSFIIIVMSLIVLLTY